MITMVIKNSTALNDNSLKQLFPTKTLLSKTTNFPKIKWIPATPDRSGNPAIVRLLGILAIEDCNGEQELRFQKSPNVAVLKQKKLPKMSSF